MSALVLLTVLSIAGAPSTSLPVTRRSVYLRSVATDWRLKRSMKVTPGTVDHTFLTSHDEAFSQVVYP